MRVELGVMNDMFRSVLIISLKRKKHISLIILKHIDYLLVSSGSLLVNIKKRFFLKAVQNKVGSLSVCWSPGLSEVCISTVMAALAFLRFPW